MLRSFKPYCMSTVKLQCWHMCDAKSPNTFLFFSSFFFMQVGIRRAPGSILAGSSRVVQQQGAAMAQAPAAARQPAVLLSGHPCWVVCSQDKEVRLQGRAKVHCCLAWSKTSELPMTGIDRRWLALTGTIGLGCLVLCLIMC